MSKQKENNDEGVSTSTAPEQPVEDAQISLQQVAQVVEVIDLCSTRGAFRGPELELVGQLRTAFATFVEANRPPTAPTDGDADASESEK